MSPPKPALSQKAGRWRHFSHMFIVLVFNGKLAILYLASETLFSPTSILLSPVVLSYSGFLTHFRSSVSWILVFPRSNSSLFLISLTVMQYWKKEYMCVYICVCVYYIHIVYLFISSFNARLIYLSIIIPMLI